MANSPVDTIRNGRLKVTIWKNSNTNGNPFFTANMVKSYKDKNDEWRETTQLTGNEISHAAALLNKAAKRVAELELEEKQAA